MQILHISDTHTFHGTFPDDRFDGIDVVIHSGDCSNVRNPYINANEVLNFLEWYKSVPVKHKIYVAGNHDSSIEKRLIDKSAFGDIIYLENNGVRLDGINFWGSPFTPTYGDWAFMKSRQKLHQHWQNIPDDTDVLITHGPPKGVRDLTYDSAGNLEQCGDTALMKRCFALKNTLKLVCFGHIHNMKGIDTNQGISHFSLTKTIFSNAACVYDGRFDLGLTSLGNVIKFP